MEQKPTRSKIKILSEREHEIPEVPPPNHVPWFFSEEKWDRVTTQTQKREFPDESS